MSWLLQTEPDEFPCLSLASSLIKRFVRNTDEMKKISPICIGDFFQDLNNEVLSKAIKFGFFLFQLRE